MCDFFPLIPPLWLYSRNIENRLIRVAIYHSHPFGILNPDGSIDGLLIKLWEHIAEENNWKYMYEVDDLNTILKGETDAVVSLIFQF